MAHISQCFKVYLTDDGYVDSCQVIPTLLAPVRDYFARYTKRPANNHVKDEWDILQKKKTDNFRKRKSWKVTAFRKVHEVIGSKIVCPVVFLFLPGVKSFALFNDMVLSWFTRFSKGQEVICFPRFEMTSWWLEAIRSFIPSKSQTIK